MRWQHHLSRISRSLYTQINATQLTEEDQNEGAPELGKGLSQGNLNLGPPQMVVMGRVKLLTHRCHGLQTHPGAGCLQGRGSLLLHTVTVQVVVVVVGSLSTIRQGRSRGSPGLHTVLTVLVGPFFGAGWGKDIVFGSGRQCLHWAKSCGRVHCG